MSIIDLILDFKDLLLGFSTAFYTFLTQSLGESIASIDSVFFDKIPIIGDLMNKYVLYLVGWITWSPLEILGGSILGIIITLIIIKKIIPVA